MSDRYREQLGGQPLLYTHILPYIHISYFVPACSFLASLSVMVTHAYRFFDHISTLLSIQHHSDIYVHKSSNEGSVESAFNTLSISTRSSSYSDLPSLYFSSGITNDHC